MKTIFKLYINSFKGLSTEVWWLALITLINRAGTMVVPFLSLYLTKGLDFSLSEVGWIMSAFGLGSVAGSWLGGKMTDLFGAYKIMVFSLILSGFLFVGLQYIESFYRLCAAVFVLMSIADMFRPAMFVALSSYSKPENKTRSVTLIRLAINLGFSAGPALGGLIITNISYGGLFWADGITCILAGILLLNVLNPKRLKIVEEDLITNAISAYKDKQFWIFIAAMLLFGLIFMQLFSTIPLYYNEGRGLSEFQIGLLFGANGLLIFIFEMPLVKWLENSSHSKSRLMLIGLAMVGSSFLILNFTGWAGILIISTLLVTFGEMIFFPFSNAYAMERAEKGNRGEYMALYSIAFSFAHVFSHNAGMQLVHGIGYTSTWYIVSAISLLAILFLAYLGYSVKKETKRV